MNCPACGLQLPPYARFCARCGTPQPNPVGSPPRRVTRRQPAWLLVLFWAGAVLSLLVAVLYAAIAVTPEAAVTPGLDPAQVGQTALIAAVLAAALFGVQVVAAVGLTAGRDWARVVATVACVGWALTCIGLPVAAVVLARLWRGGAADR